GGASEMISRLRESGLWNALGCERGDNCNTSNRQLSSQYFKARQAAQISAASLRRWQDGGEQDMLVVDVRNPIPPVPTRIPGSYALPERDITTRFNEL